MEETTFLPPDQARALINELGRKHTLVIRFIKKGNRQERRMQCRYYGQASRYKHLMKVWDMEAGANRDISLDEILSITPIKKPTRSRTDRQPQARSFQEVKAEMDELFY